MISRLKQGLPFKLSFTVGYGLLALLANRLGIRCLFLQFFGIPCPGCGMTRALLCLLRLDLRGAAAYHPMVFALPLMYLYFLLSGRLFRQKWADAALWSAIGAGFFLHWLQLLL